MHENSDDFSDELDEFEESQDDQKKKVCYKLKMKHFTSPNPPTIN